MTLFFMTPKYLKRLTGQRGTLITGLLLVMLLVPSCIPQKKILYLQRQAEEAREIYPFTDPPDYRIKTGDILYIQVLTLDEQSHAMFNTERATRTTSAGGGGGIGNLNMFLHGYNVNEQGNITMPVIGEVVLAGKTLEEATQYIGERVEEYLIGATVLVKIVNYSITVLGEIGSPGRYYVYDNRVSILDLIAVAGDLTDFSNREVVIVRQTEEGATFGSIDITHATALSSEYFYLQPDDIVYVQPRRIKRYGINVFNLSLIFSTVSFGLFLYTLIFD